MPQSTSTFCYSSQHRQCETCACRCHGHHLDTTAPGQDPHPALEASPLAS